MLILSNIIKETVTQINACRQTNSTEANPLPDNDHIEFILVFFTQPWKLNLTFLHGLKLDWSQQLYLIKKRILQIMLRKKTPDITHCLFCSHHVSTWPLIGAESAAERILAVDNGQHHHNNNKEHQRRNCVKAGDKETVTQIQSQSSFYNDF